MSHPANKMYFSVKNVTSNVDILLLYLVPVTNRGPGMAGILALGWCKHPGPGKFFDIGRDLARFFRPFLSKTCVLIIIKFNITITSLLIEND